jgi:hypothetical protein
MARPVVGIYAQDVPASWGPWVDRPSLVAPAILGDAVQRAGAMAVLLAPDPDLERCELLSTLDALVVLGAGGDVLGTARELGIAVLAVDAARLAQDATGADLERELAALL